MPNEIIIHKLSQQISQCNLCSEELPMGPNPVAILSSTAKVLIVGQAPGVRVHETGIPFNDASGNRLRQWMGISREQFYNPDLFAIVPMGFCYPGTGKNGDLPPLKACANKWREQVLQSMPQIELTLCIGQYAINWHLGNNKKSNLTNTVKAWKEYFPHYFPLPHPSPRNNIWLKRNPWFEKNVIPELQKYIQMLHK